MIAVRTAAIEGELVTVSCDCNSLCAGAVGVFDVDVVELDI